MDCGAAGWPSTSGEVRSSKPPLEPSSGVGAGGQPHRRSVAGWNRSGLETRPLGFDGAEAALVKFKAARAFGAAELRFDCDLLGGHQAAANHASIPSGAEASPDPIRSARRQSPRPEQFADLLVDV